MAIFLIPFPVIAAVVFGPFMSALVRYRANYEPRNVQLDGEDSPPRVDGYFAMLKRIYELEGWSGLYKGSLFWLLTQYLIDNVYYYLFGFLDFLFFHTLPFRIASPLLFVSRMLYILLLGIPSATILYRAICTPYVLPIFSPGVSLSVLLSPTERRKPWKLYLTPGLLVLHIALNTPIRAIETSGTLMWTNVAHGYLALYLLAVLLTSMVLSPLPVMIIRLSLQRNHDYYDDGNPLSTEPKTEAEQAAAFNLSEFSKDEEVVGLRDEDDPYTSLYDCFKRMLNEESWRVFYRAYWATVFGQIQWLLPAILYTRT